MNRIFLFLIIMMFSITSFAQDVVINEVQAKNDKTYIVSWQRNYHNWIELKNNTSSPIDLSGWFLSDNPDKTNKWTFPADTKIEANSYLVIFFDGVSTTYDKQIYTDFDISISGETIILSSSSGAELHRIEYENLLNNFSYGRLSDGSYSRMSKPSPNAENISNSAFSYLDSELSVNLSSGLYNTPINVELTTTGDNDIYYTLDGTTPTASSSVYTTPINISNSTVLKAIEIKSTNEFSFIEHRSYIFGASHSLPIILLSSDNSYLKSNNKEVIDGRVEFSFIETDGETVINQYANFSESGKTSKGCPQLNGKIKANKMYGKSSFKHKMYPDKKIDKFNSFLFRNASQDWLNTHLRDGFISKILGQDNLFGIPFEAYRPAVLYVNAKYQGIINIREDDDNDYIEHNYGLKKGEFRFASSRYSDMDVDSYDFTKPEDREAFDKLVSFKEHISMKLLREYTSEFEDAGGTWEDLAGKTKYQYHYQMHDFDAILGWQGNKTKIIHNPIMKEDEWGYFNEPLEGNIKNDETYKGKALQIMAAQINHIYNEKRTLRILDEMQNELKSEIPAHALKAFELVQKLDTYYEGHDKPFTNLAEWNKNIDDLRTNIKSRIDADVFNRIKTRYKLDGVIDITYTTSDIKKGIIKVQEIKILDESSTGTYFSNIPIKFSAKPLPGYKFVRWEGDFASTDKEIAPVFSANSSIKAIFEPITTITDSPVINEVQGKNDNTIADENGEFDDWIEIYNPTDIDVDLADYYISDSFDKPLKWKITNTNSAKTTVPAKGFLLLWADKDTEQGENHLDFKLKGTDNVILTKPDGLTTIQYIEYSDVESDKSFSAQTDGSETFIITDKPTPKASNTTISIDIYTVIFNDWDNTLIKNEQIKKGDPAISPTYPTRNGYTFSNWDVDFGIITTNLTVTAQYEINSFNVVFNDYDNTELKSETVEYNKSATAPTNPIRTGYTFTDWDVDFGIITTNLTVTAQYAINSFNVVFNDYDGTELKSETVEYNKSATAPTNPTRTGYTFTDWDYNFDNVKSDLTITAQYNKNTAINYIVIFRDKDNATIKTESITEHSSATAPEAPIVEGYSFISWDKDFSNVISDLIVAAQYSINTFNVVFNDYDNTELKSETVEFEKSATAPVNPTRNGYTFSGWDVDFGIITTNLTVTAKYKQNATVITEVNIENIKIYPNPVKDILNIKLSNSCISKYSKIIILNSIGNPVYQTENSISIYQSIDVSNLSSGVYYVKIGNNVAKFIKY